MDDLSVRRVINAVAPVVPRNYVIMEVKSNLVASERKEVLKRFSAPHFKKVAQVVMGEPTENYKKTQIEKLLHEKQEKADLEWRAKKAEEERKRQVEVRQKQLQEMRKKADEQRKKAAEEAKKKAEEAKKKADEAKAKKEDESKSKEAAEVGGVEGTEDVEMKGNEENKEGDDNDKNEEKKADDDCEEPKVDEVAPMEVDELKDMVKENDENNADEMETKEKEGEEGPPKVELTEEEEKMWFRPQPGAPDLTSTVLSQSFAYFTIPEKDEGFDAIRYEWQNEETSKEYLRKWVLEKKLTSRMEDLQPSQWFKDKLAEWQKNISRMAAKAKSVQGFLFKCCKGREEG